MSAVHYLTHQRRQSAVGLGRSTQEKWRSAPGNRFIDLDNHIVAPTKAGTYLEKQKRECDLTGFYGSILVWVTGRFAQLWFVAPLSRPVHESKGEANLTMFNSQALEQT